MKKSLLSVSSLLALAVVCGAGSAQAQSMDYGSLQDLFGEPVTTSATGTPQRVSEAPANMTIVTADEIRQSGSRSIPQILSRVPGLDILQGGLNSFDVGVRGYQQGFQPRLLVLIDGRQVFIDDYSRTIWDNIPVNVDDIRQIEVVKGAASALFGSNAAGGVINIVTYSPVYDNSNVANVTMGTQNEMTGDATTTIKGSWGGTKTSVGGLSAKEFGQSPQYPGNDVKPHDPFHRYVTNNTIVQVNNNLQLNSEANFSDSRSYVIDPTDFGTMGDQHTTTYSVGVGANWQSPIGLISNNNYFNHTYIDLLETTSGGDGTHNATAPYGLTTDLLVSQLQDQFKIGSDHTFRVGTEYRFKAFKDSGIQQTNQPTSIDQGNVAVNGSWLWNINDKWSWTNAARLDHSEMQQTGQLATGVFYGYDAYSHVVNALSANSDLVYKATENDSFRLGYGRGVQMPSLMNAGWNMFMIYGANGLTDYEGNPKLKPTIVQDYSLDYNRKLPSISSDIKFSIYYELNQDIAQPFAGPGTTRTVAGQSVAFYASQNVGNSKGWGGEVELKGKSTTGFRWDASYSYARVADSNSVAAGVDYQGSAPQHHGRLNLGYTTGKWELDSAGQIVSGTNGFRSLTGGEDNRLLSQGGYTSLAARIGYNLNDRATLAVSGTNLTRQYTPETIYPAIERQVFGSLTVKF